MSGICRVEDLWIIFTQSVFFFSLGQQPPPYSEATENEVYSKQAPYNPNFQ
jgi:hypothetical protein